VGRGANLHSLECGTGSPDDALMMLRLFVKRTVGVVGGMEERNVG
jgi:hypothetical protein